jgi:hypothetical protein
MGVYFQMNWLLELFSCQIDFFSIRQDIPEMIISLIEYDFATIEFLENKGCHGTLTYFRRTLVSFLLLDRIASVGIPGFAYSASN